MFPDLPSRTLPDRIADELIARVFVGELAPGETLSAERVLAQQLGVDRTSLRIALRQLTRMRVLRVIRGSGMTVLDYRRHAGLDFLAAVLEVPGLELGGAFLLEVLDHWNRAMPDIVSRAFARATPDSVRRLDALFGEQLRVLDADGSLEEVTEIELDVHDCIVDMVGDTTLQLIANSTRGLRRKLTRLQLDLVDPREQIETQRAQVRRALGTGVEPSAMRQAHAKYLRDHHEPLRQTLVRLPPNPRRTIMWQKAPRSSRAEEST